MAALFPLIIVLALGVVLVTSQRRRSRDARAIQQQVAVGTQIMTTSGLYGWVVGVDDTSVRLEVADGVIMRFARAAVGRVVPEPAPESEGELSAEHDPTVDSPVDGEETAEEGPASSDRDAGGGR